MSWGLRDVGVRFDRLAALDGVSLEPLVPHVVTGVVGGDGAGKTTLLRVLAGALAPATGEVRRPPAERIGYLAATSGTYPDLTVAENIDFAAAAYGLSGAEARRRAADFLERMGLAAAQDRLAGQLSGGMRQKLGVIRAMLHRPDLLVLDEPTTGIDPVSRADLWWLIARAAADGAAVVFATTYMDEAERAAQLLVLDEGRPLAAGKPAEIVASMPGSVGVLAARPTGPAARRAWRRRAEWRVWEPDGDGDGPASVTADLQDAVTVFSLARELAGSRTP